MLNISLNVQKCFVLHLGSKNQKYAYTLNGSAVQIATSEKDLGIIIDDNLSFSEHVSTMCKKANRRLGMLLRSFILRDYVLLTSLYKTYVRPIFEYCSEIESVQRRFTRCFAPLRELSYKERLRIYS